MPGLMAKRTDWIGLALLVLLVFGLLLNAFGGALT